MAAATPSPPPALIRHPLFMHICLATSMDVPFVRLFTRWQSSSDSPICSSPPRPLSLSPSPSSTHLPSSLSPSSSLSFLATHLVFHENWSE
ncbi:hypothetical protein SLA2020_044700 [Shorea laevis]